MKPRQHLALSIAEPRFDRLWHIRRRKCLTPEPSLSVVHARRPHEECLRRSFHAFRDSPRAEHARKRDYASQQTVGGRVLHGVLDLRAVDLEHVQGMPEKPNASVGVPGLGPVLWNMRVSGRLCWFGNGRP